MKRIAILILSVVGFSLASFAQGGNTCAAAQLAPVTVGTSYTGQTTCGKANDYTGTGSTCLSTLYYGAEDWFYYFCAPTSGCITFSLNNLTSGVAGKPAYLSFSIFDGCPGTGSCVNGSYQYIAANTTLAAGPSIQVNATAGKCYYIVVDAYSYTSYAGCVNFTLNSSIVPPLTQTPGGNTCSGAQANPITIGSTYTNQTTCCGGNDYAGTGSTCMGGAGTYNSANDWYYYFCATQTGCVTFSMPNTSSGVSGVPVYASLSAYDGCPGSSSCVAGNYTYVGAGTTISGPSINFIVTAGKCYYIVVDGYSIGGTYANCAKYSLTSTFQLPVTQTPGGATCTAAIANPLTIGSTYNNQTTCCTGNNYQGTNSCLSTTYHSANDWMYYVCATQSGYLQVNLTNITSSVAAYPSISVFNACPGTAGACVSTNYVYISAGVAGTQTLLINAVAGQCYFILVDGYGDPYANCVKYSISTSFSTIPKNPTCNNMDFETGNLTGWFGNTGTATMGAVGAPTPMYTLTSIGIVAGRQTIVGPAGTDPCGGFPVVGAGSRSLKLGNNVTGAQGEQVSQTFLVTAANASFTYRYAVVLEDPGHTSNMQPFFMALMTDQTGKKIPCSEFIVSAAASLPGFFNSTACASVRYKPWSTVNVDLTSYIGTYVTIQFTTGDCSASGHYGYAYVDAQCGASILASNNDTICPGQCTPLSAPVGYASYLWQPGNLTTTTINACPTTTTVYTLTLTGFNGCKTTNYDTIWVSPNPVANFTFTAPGCNKPINFINTSTITAPSTITNYSWTFQGGTPASSTNQNPANITWSAPGTYNVTLTVSTPIGCTSSVTKQVVIPACTISVSILGDSVCAGNCHTLNATASLGVPPYTFAWSPNIGSGPGPHQVCPTTTTVYTVTLTDSQGTANTDVATVAIYPAVNVTVTASNITCNGKSDGSITANPSSGGSPYTYNWSAPASAQTTKTITALAPGGYTVTVTDKNGCSSTSSATITEPAALTTTITSPVLNNCNGGTTSATITASGGITPYTYSWSDPGGQTTSTATGLAAGITYTATVTDNNGCISTSSVTITGSGIPPTVTAVSSGNLTCTITSVTLTGTSAGNTMVWNGGLLTNATDPATVSTAGTYTVTATDGTTGCTATQTVTVTSNTTVPHISIATPAQLTCTVTSTTLTGSSTTPGVIFQWTGGPATATYSVSAAGIYTLTVTDTTNGCTATQTVTVVSSPGVPDISATTSQITCSNPTVILTGSSTTSGATFQWTGGPATATYSVSVAAIYTLTVTDPSNGCTASQTVTVTADTIVPDISIAPPLQLTCINTSVTLTGSSVTSGVNYQWTTGPATASNTVSAGGIYTLTITNPTNGCTATQTVTVAANTIVPDISIATPPALTCTDTIATLTGNSTTPGVTFQWKGGPANDSNTVSTTGIYTLTVTDTTNGCIASQTVTIISNTAVPNISIATPAQLTCTVTSVTLTGSSTTSGATFQWTGGPATATYSISAAGVYTLTVTDTTNGCTATQTVTVAASPGVPDISATPSQITCSNPTVILTGSSSTSGATFQWTGGPATATYSVSVAAIYTLTVTDPSNGCTASQTVTVTADTIVPDISIAPPLQLTCINTSVTLTGSSVTSGVNYQWTTGPATASNTVSAAGIYTLTITDPANGCTATQTVTVAANTTVPDISIATPQGLTCTDTIATLTGSSITPGVTYQWTGGPANDSNTVSTTGIYTLIVTDTTNGCISTQTATVTSNTAVPDISIATPAQLTCTVTSVTLTGSSTTPGATFQWTGGPATATYSVSAAGVYTLTVTDTTNGCTALQTVTVAASPGVPDISATPSQITCSSPSVILTGSSTTSGATFQWTGGPATATYSVSVAAIYTLTVTDPSNGCTASQTVTVTADTLLPDISISTPAQLTCIVTSVTLTGNSTTPGATYQWTNGPATASYSVSAAAIYTLTVTNPTNGCTATQTVTVTSSPGVPDISIAPPLPLNCINTNVTLKGSSTSSGVNFQWTGGPASDSNTVSTAGIYTITVTDPANGCTASQTVTVINNTTPPVVTATVSGNLSCIVTSVTLTGTSPGNIMVWNGGALTNAADPSTVSAAGIYTVTATDTTNGCTATQTVTVTANPGVPDISITSPPPLTCTNRSVTLTGSSATTGVTFQWTGGPATDTNTVSVAGIYTLIVTDPANGCTAQQAVTVMIDTIPPTVTATGSGSLTCRTTSVVLTGAAAGSSLVWNGGTLNNAADPATITAPGTYTVTATDLANGCTSTQPITVVQIGGITLSTESTATACGGATGTITAHVAGGTPSFTYEWDHTTGRQTDSVAVNLIAGAYTVTATDANGCTATATDTVKTAPPPVLTIVPAQQTIMDGHSVAITVTGASTYTWLPASGLSCTNCSNPIAKPTTTTTYTVVAADDNGCTVTAMLMITIKQACIDDESAVYVANIFSPNNDGKNDILFIEGNGLSRIYWAIYDRWGNLLFEAFDQVHGWDGTYKGTEMEHGTYVYYLRATCIKTNVEVKLKGNVTIVK